MLYNMELEVDSELDLRIEDLAVTDSDGDSSVLVLLVPPNGVSTSDSSTHTGKKARYYRVFHQPDTHPWAKPSHKGLSYSMW